MLREATRYCCNRSKTQKLRDITVTDFKIDGYVMHATNAANRTGRGILIYVHESTRVNDIEILVEYEESCWIGMNLVNSDTLLIGCIYRSDDGTQDNNNNLLEVFRKAQSLNYSQLLDNG
jgi:hypothetical protein